MNESATKEDGTEEFVVIETKVLGANGYSRKIDVIEEANVLGQSLKS